MISFFPEKRLSKSIFWKQEEKNVSKYRLLIFFYPAYYALTWSDMSFTKSLNKKTRQFKYIENFTTKKWKLSDEKFQ